MSFEEILRAELEKVMEPLKKDLDEIKKQSYLNKFPPMLTVEQLMQFMQIKRSKASELLNRSDFPVNREAGVKIPTHMLVRWIETNTRWVEQNAKHLKREVV
jgi:predicted DNA-binding transcriptional regulator AlpA